MIEDLADQLREDILLHYKEGDRLPSERVLAERFHSTQSKIHRALAILIREKLLFTKVGHGTFLSPLPKAAILFPSDENLYSDRNSMFGSYGGIVLKVRILLGSNYEERHTWEKVFQLFTEMYPYIHIEPEYFSAAGKVDVEISTIQDFFRKRELYQPIRQDEFSSFGYPVEDICDHCEKLQDDGAHGIMFSPVFRIPSVLLVNQTLVDQFGVDPAIFSDCGTLFQQAEEIERSKKIAVLNYWGYHWHGCYYGLKIEERDGICELDWDLLSEMFQDFKKFSSCGNMFNSSRTTLFQERKMLSVYTYNHQKEYILPGAELRIVNPCKPGGFPPESIICAGVTANSGYAFEAKLFASFLARAEAQRILQNDFSEWISVNKQVLRENGRENDCSMDLRPYYSIFSKHIFFKFGPLLNVSVARYCLGLQTWEQVLRTLKEGAAVTPC